MSALVKGWSYIAALLSRAPISGSSDGSLHLPDEGRKLLHLFRCDLMSMLTATFIRNITTVFLVWPFWVISSRKNRYWSLTMITTSSAYPAALQPCPFISSLNSSVIKFHRNGDSTPSCGQPNVTFSTIKVSPLKAVTVWRANMRSSMSMRIPLAPPGPLVKTHLTTGGVRSSFRLIRVMLSLIMALLSYNYLRASQLLYRFEKLHN